MPSESQIAQEAPSETLQPQLKIVDSRDHDLVVRDQQGNSVKELENACRHRLRKHLQALADLQKFVVNNLERNFEIS